MSYLDAEELAHLYDESLPRPQPFGDAVLSGGESHVSSKFDQCGLSVPDFSCRLNMPALFRQDHVDSGTTSMEVTLSAYGTDDYNPIANFTLDLRDVKRRGPDAEYYNVGPETEGTVLFAVVEWDYPGEG
jgi:hypothetical protein